MCLGCSFIVFFLSSLMSINVFAHSGGLDAKSGHTDRKLNVYHCHRDYCQSRVINDKIPYE